MRDAYGTELRVGDVVSVATRKPIEYVTSRAYHGTWTAKRLAQYKGVVEAMTDKSIGVRPLVTLYADRVVYLPDSEWFNPRQVVKL